MANGIERHLKALNGIYFYTYFTPIKLIIHRNILKLRKLRK